MSEPPITREDVKNRCHQTRAEADAFSLAIPVKGDMIDLTDAETKIAIRQHSYLCAVAYSWSVTYGRIVNDDVEPVIAVLQRELPPR